MCLKFIFPGDLEAPGWQALYDERGAVLVNLVLCGCAAYRTRLFLYLKACGREELNTMIRPQAECEGDVGGGRTVTRAFGTSAFPAIRAS